MIVLVADVTVVVGVVVDVVVVVTVVVVAAVDVSSSSCCGYCRLVPGCGYIYAVIITCGVVVVFVVVVVVCTVVFSYRCCCFRCCGLHMGAVSAREFLKAKEKTLYVLLFFLLLFAH